MSLYPGSRLPSLPLLLAGLLATWLLVVAALGATGQARLSNRKPSPSEASILRPIKELKKLDMNDVVQIIEHLVTREDFDSQRISYENNPTRLLNGYYKMVIRSPIQTSDIAELYPELHKTGHIREGLKEGTWRIHYLAANSTLDCTETYRDGFLNGPFTVYNADQTVHYQTALTGGNGVWKSFYTNGQLALKGRYQAGRQHGAWVRYGRNGRVEEQLVYEHGVLRRTPPTPTK